MAGIHRCGDDGDGDTARASAAVEEFGELHEGDEMALG